MSPKDIYSELRAHGTNGSDVARQRGVTPTMVGHVIHRRFVSRHIEDHICRVIGRPHKEVFPTGRKVAA